jgi:hypothetical protein
LPTGPTADLVRAAALEAGAALSAWRRAAPELDAIGPVRERFLPSVYANLVAVTDDPSITRLKEIHKRTWMYNEVVIRRAADVIELLRAADIPVIVLKGAALASLYYRDVGARVMSDVDLLIGPENARRAVQVVQQHGWLEVVPAAAPTGPLKYAFHVEHPNAGNLDLHKYALSQSADDEDLRDHAVRFALEGAETMTLSPTDHLLHVCIHGLRWVEVGPTAWIVDATKILRTAPIDWARLVERATARLLTVPLACALELLRDEYEADIPEDVIRAIKFTRAPLFERAAHRALVRRPNTIRFGIASWDRYRRFALLARPTDQPSGFTDFLRSGWELEDRGLLRHVVGKVISRNHRDLAA